MNAFVEGKCRARRSRRQTGREEINNEGGKKEGKDALTHTHRHKQSQAARHKLHRGSCGDLFDICSMHPIDICATYLNEFPFPQRGNGTHTGSWDVIKSYSYAFGIKLEINTPHDL